ncbi:MAG: ROK family protein [Myxococcaceae bacterium]
MRTLGIDLGGTSARAALLDERGALLRSAKVQLQDRRPEAVVEAIAVAVKEAMVGHPIGEPVACGVGVAGQLKGDTGFVSVGPNLGWRDVPFGALLSNRLGHAVRVVNDLSAAAWGELKVGAGKGARDIFVVFVGSGVGSALIVNGTLTTGATGVAGEFGHIKVIPDGRECGCGERGCLEAYAGGHSLIAQMKERGLGGAEPNPALLEKAAMERHAASRELYDAVAHHLSLAIANQVTVLNPARVILGGGVLMNCPGLRQRISAGVEKYASRTSRAAVTLCDAALGDDSGIIGAGLLALEPS